MREDGWEWIFKENFEFFCMGHFSQSGSLFPTGYVYAGWRRYTFLSARIHPVWYGKLTFYRTSHGMPFYWVFGVVFSNWSQNFDQFCDLHGTKQLTLRRPNPRGITETINRLQLCKILSYHQQFNSTVGFGLRHCCLYCFTCASIYNMTARTDRIHVPWKRVASEIWRRQKMSVADAFLILSFFMARGSKVSVSTNFNTFFL